MYYLKNLLRKKVKVTVKTLNDVMNPTKQIRLPDVLSLFTPRCYEPFQR